MSDKACTLPRTTGDLYVEVSDGRFTAMTLATPADIAAAHPKCGTCDHFERQTDWNGAGACINPESPHNLHDDSLHCRSEVDPTTDYCPHHSEINP
jgi:hypothetical protein